MTAVPRANPDAAFELKSAALTLLALVLKTADLDRLAQALAAQREDAPGLFDDDAVAVDVAALRDAGTAVDFDALVVLLREHRMRPIAVRGAEGEMLAAAQAAGLVEAPESAAPAPARTRMAGSIANEATVPDAPAAAAAPQGGPGPAPATPPEPASAPSSALAPSVPGYAKTMVVDRPLRSGQQVYARGGDLVVLAAVNHGAEVIADGSIHVYAPLRGRAVAGARGDATARIFATCMEPQLVSIAGTYRTIESALPVDVQGKPAQVRLVDDRLVLEPLKT